MDGGWRVVPVFSDLGRESRTVDSFSESLSLFPPTRRPMALVRYGSLPVPFLSLLPSSHPSTDGRVDEK